MLTENTSQTNKRTPWRFLLLLTVVLVAITASVPIANRLQTPRGANYTGFSYESVGDTFVYLNLIEQAKNGHLLFSDMFTPETHEPALFHALFLVIGWVAKVGGLSPLLAWHVVRLALIFPMLLVLWKLVATTTFSLHTRKLMLVVAVFAGGVGLASGESSIFMMVLFSPKAITTLVLVSCFFLLFLSSRPWWWRWPLLLLIACAQASIQPYVLPLMGLVPFFFLLLEGSTSRFSLRRSIQQLLPVLLALGVAGLGLFIMVWRSPVLHAWSENAAEGRWSVGQFALLLVPLLPFVAVGVRSVWRHFSSDLRLRFFAAWLIAGMALSFSAYPFAYRIPGYVLFSYFVFAALGLAVMWRERERLLWIRGIIVVLLVLGVSDASQHVFLNIQRSYAGAGNVYLAADEAAAVTWIRDATPADSIVLASPSWDTLLTQQTYRRSYVTLGWQTLRHIERTAESLRFYDGEYAPDEAREFLAAEHITHVMMSVRERTSGNWVAWDDGKVGFRAVTTPDFQAGRYPFLTQVFSQGSVTVYAVNL